MATPPDVTIAQLIGPDSQIGSRRSNRANVTIQEFGFPGLNTLGVIPMGRKGWEIQRDGLLRSEEKTTQQDATDDLNNILYNRTSPLDALHLLYEQATLLNIFEGESPPLATWKRPGRARIPAVEQRGA